MVDNTIGVSEHGINSVEKNAGINLCVEAHRLKLHVDKSVFLHVGNVRKFDKTPP